MQPRMLYQRIGIIGEMPKAVNRLTSSGGVSGWPVRWGLEGEEVGDLEVGVGVG